MCSLSNVEVDSLYTCSSNYQGCSVATKNLPGYYSLKLSFFKRTSAYAVNSKHLSDTVNYNYTTVGQPFANEFRFQ